MHWEYYMEAHRARDLCAQNHSLWLSPLNNKTANHHVVVRLHKAASTDVAQD